MALLWYHLFVKPEPGEVNIMDSKKKLSLSAVIIHCICAVVWNIILILDLAFGYTYSVSFALHILCAITQDICALIWIVRYINSKKHNA